MLYVDKNRNRYLKRIICKILINLQEKATMAATKQFKKYFVRSALTVMK
jgi:hypothetical protein